VLGSNSGFGAKPDKRIKEWASAISGIPFSSARRFSSP
jgi:hypothetical protein